MIVMLLSVMHGQVQKQNEQKHIIRESNGFHNHSTLIITRLVYKLFAGGREM